MVPTPIAGHEVAVTALPITKVAVGDIVKRGVEINVSKNVVDNLPRVAIPQSVFLVHPLRCS